MAVQIVGAFETHVGRGWLPSDLNGVTTIIKLSLDAVLVVIAA